MGSFVTILGLALGISFLLWIALVIFGAPQRIRNAAALVMAVLLGTALVAIGGSMLFAPPKEEGRPAEPPRERPLRSADDFLERARERKRKGDVAGALADYTTALRLEPNVAFTHFERGRVSWSVPDFAGATADFRRANELDPSMDYMRFFLFLTEAETDGLWKATERLKARRASRGAPIQSGTWIDTLDRFLEGEISQEQLLEVADHATGRTRSDNLCEGLFYAGMLARLRGSRVGAEDLLRRCVDMDRTDFAEHWAAKDALAWPK